MTALQNHIGEPNSDKLEGIDVLETFYLSDKEHKGLNEFIIVTVFPCGKEDGSHLLSNDPMDKPYMIKIQKKMNENSLKDIFVRSKPIWEPIYNKYLFKEQVPNFSIYRKPYDMQMRKNKEQG